MFGYATKNWDKENMKKSKSRGKRDDTDDLQGFGVNEVTYSSPWYVESIQ